KSAMATGTFVSVQLPIAMLFTLLLPKRSQLRPNKPPTFEPVFSTARPNVFTLLTSMTVLGERRPEQTGDCRIAAPVLHLRGPASKETRLACRCFALNARKMAPTPPAKELRRIVFS